MNSKEVRDHLTKTCPMVGMKCTFCNAEVVRSKCLNHKSAQCLKNMQSTYDQNISEHLSLEKELETLLKQVPAAEVKVIQSHGQFRVDDNDRRIDRLIERNVIEERQNIYRPNQRMFFPTFERD